MDASSMFLTFCGCVVRAALVIFSIDIPWFVSTSLVNVDNEQLLDRTILFLNRAGYSSVVDRLVAMVEFRNFFHLVLICIALQLFTACCIRKISNTFSSYHASFCFYYFNPVTIVVCAVSVSDALFQLIVVFVILTVQCQYYFLAIVAVTALMQWNFHFFALFPPLIWHFYMCYFLSKKELRWHQALYAFVIISSFVIAISTIVLISSHHNWVMFLGNEHISHRSLWSVDSVFALYDFCENTLHTYQPGVGVFWYLQAEIFSQFAIYFQILFNFQPYVYSFPLSIRFSGAPIQPVIIMTMIILLFMPCSLGAVSSASLSNISLIVTLLLCDTSIIQHVKHLSVVVPGVLIPSIISPLSMLLWVSVGNGNANYLFFQGVLLYMMVSITIVGYTSALVHKIDLKAAKVP